MANLGNIERGNGTDIRQLQAYVQQLEEQVRYVLGHLDEENLAAGTIDASKLSAGVQGKLASAEASIKQLQGAAGRAASAISQLQGAVVNSAHYETGTLPFTICVADTQPAGENILWFRPTRGTPGNVFACDAYYIEEEST